MVFFVVENFFPMNFLQLLNVAPKSVPFLWSVQIVVRPFLCFTAPNCVFQVPRFAAFFDGPLDAGVKDRNLSMACPGAAALEG